MKKATSFLVTTALAIALSSCASEEPNFGQQLITQGGEVASIGQRWNKGKTMVAKGKSLVKDGNSAQKKGRKMVRKGEDMIDKGNQLMTTARQSFDARSGQGADLAPAAQ